MAKEFVASNAVPAGEAPVAIESAESREKKDDKKSLGEASVKFRFKLNYIGIAVIAATVVGSYVGFKLVNHAVK